MLWPTETYERQRIKFNDSSFIQMEGCEIEWFYFPLFSCSFQICFHCMKTKFGLFYRGHSCEMCKQTFCTRCHTKVSNSLTVIKQHKSSSLIFNSISHKRPLSPVHLNQSKIFSALDYTQQISWLCFFVLTFASSKKRFF